MKKLTKIFVTLLFCLVLAVTGMSTAFAANNMAKVSNLKASATYNSVTLTWSAVSGATGYEIEQYKSGKWVEIKDKSDKYTTTKITVSSLSFNTTYKFRVRASKIKTLTTDYSKSWVEVSAKTALTKVDDLKAENDSSTSVKLTWDKVSGAQGYQVYRSTDGKKWTKVDSTTKNTLTVKKLTYDKSYQFKVRAYRKSGSKTYYGAYSAVEKIKTAIPMPAEFKVSKSAYNYVNLTWGEVSGAKDYVVYRSTDGKKWSTLATTTKESYKDTKVTTGTKYYYRVRARQTISSKTKYSAYTATVNVTPSLSKLTSLKVVTGIDAVELSWKKVSGADGYQVYSSLDGKKWTKQPTVKKGSTVTATISGLTPDTKYYFRVRAYKALSKGNTYGSYCSAVDATPGTLSAVSGVTTDSITTSAAELSWTAVKFAGGYEVLYSSNGGASWVTNDAKGNSISLSGLSNEVAYLVKVRAYDVVNEKTYYGDYSTPAVVKLVPGEVKDFYIEAYTDSLKLTWKDCPSASGYEIAYAISGSGKWKKVTTTANTYKFTDLEANTMIKFKIRQYLTFKDSNKYGEYVTGQATTGTVNKAAMDSYGRVKLSWNAVEGAASYEIQSYMYYNENWAEATSANKTTDTELFYSPTFKSGNLIRVVALDENGNILSGYEPVFVAKQGYKAEVKSNNCVDLSWPAVSGAKYYAICDVVSTSRYINYGVVTTNYVNNLPIAPGEISNILILAFDKKPANANEAMWNSISGVMEGGQFYFSLPANDLKIDSSNESKTSQLLYLVSAINNTKQTGNVTVNKHSVFETNMKSMKMGLLTIDFEDLASLPGGLGDEIREMLAGEDLTETTDLTYTFPENGVYIYTVTDENGDSKTKRVTLSSFVEPTDSSYAYLYNAMSTSSWKNGFSSVTSTKQADGSVKVTIKLKQEKFGTKHDNETAYYHPGFASTVSDVAVDETLSHKDSSVGATTITAVINESGLLESYTIKSPYTMTMAGEIDGMAVEMSVYGDVDTRYTFTR